MHRPTSIPAELSGLSLREDMRPSIMMWLLRNQSAEGDRFISVFSQDMQTRTRKAVYQKNDQDRATS